MQIAIVGLGRMGGNIARRLIAHGHEVVAFDRDAGAAAKLGGAVAATTLDDVIKKLRPPRAIWVMLPAGSPTEETVATLALALERGDVVIDGRNTFFKDDIRRGRALS